MELDHVRVFRLISLQLLLGTLSAQVSASPGACSFCLPFM